MNARFVVGRAGNKVATVSHYLPNSPHKSPLRVCDLCFRESTGHVVQYRALPEFPAYHSCSTVCDDILLELVVAGRGYIPQDAINEARRKAIPDGRHAFLHQLSEIGKWGQLGGITDQLYKKIDAVVIATISGIVASMHAQSIAALPVEKKTVT